MIINKGIDIKEYLILTPTIPNEGIKYDPTKIKHRINKDTIKTFGTTVLWYTNFAITIPIANIGIRLITISFSSAM